MYIFPWSNVERATVHCIYTRNKMLVKMLIYLATFIKVLQSLTVNKHGKLLTSSGKLSGT